jgi:hypothetical protein
MGLPLVSQHFERVCQPVKVKTEAILLIGRGGL